MLNNEHWRFYDTTPIFTIVNTNTGANIPKDCIVTDNSYIVDKQKVYILCPKGDTGP